MGISSNTEYDKLITGSFTAVNQTLDIGGPNTGTESIQVTDTWVGTIVFEVSNDNTNWVQRDVVNVNNDLQLVSITANGIYICNAAGFANKRIRSSVWTSGTANINNAADDHPSVMISASESTVNLPTPGTATLIAGTDGTNLRAVSVDATGRLNINSGSSELPTFVVAAYSVVIALNKSMLSIVNVTGSPVTIKLRELYIVNVQNVALVGIVSQFQIKRITGHSVGTALVAAAHDTNDALNSNVTARTGATVAGETADVFRRYTWSSDEWVASTADQESNDHAHQINNNLIAQAAFCKPITLRANQGISIKQITNSALGSFDLFATFTQE